MQDTTRRSFAREAIRSALLSDGYSALMASIIIDDLVSPMTNAERCKLRRQKILSPSATPWQEFCL